MSGGESATLDAGSLKVAELKEELAKRNLPTNGLKKDLASRLEEALQSQESNDEKKPEEQPDADVKEEEQMETQESEGAQNIEVPSELVVDAKEDVHTTEETSQDVQLEAPKKEEQEAQPSLIERIADADVKADEAQLGDVEEDVKLGDELVGSDVETKEQIAEVNGTSLQDRMGLMEGGNDQDVIDLGVEVDADMHSDDPVPLLSHSNDVSRSQSRDVKVAGDEGEGSLTQSGLSPYADPPATLTAEQTVSTKSLSSLSEEEKKLERPSRSIYITGLVRPLTLPAFRAKVEEFGDLGGEGVEEGQQVWLDGVKTHAYVTYQKEQSAVVAKAALSGSVYPPETGKMIQACFIPQMLVKQCIAVEEQAWQKDRGKVEMRARVAEDGESLLYSLHSVEASSIVVSRLDTTLPPISRPSNSSNRGSGSTSYKGRSQQAPYIAKHSHTYLQVQNYGHGRANGGDRRGGYRRDDQFSNRGSGRYEHEERGLSRADDRVREVEARIRADRERGGRGFVNENLMTGRHGRQIFYDGRAERTERSRYPDVPPPRWSGNESSSRAAYVDRNRDLSPPPKRREYSDGPRDDRSRRDW